MIADGKKTLMNVLCSKGFWHISRLESRCLINLAKLQLAGDIYAISPYLSFVRAVLTLLLFTSLPKLTSAGCTDGGGGGCSPPVGEKWDRWDMAGSTYTYCYHGCAVDWLYNNTDKFGLNKYGGVVGVDHYWTHQVRQQEISHSI